MNRTLIIAEAGVNHNGDIKKAKKLIDAASKAGVDYVKFQTFKAKNLVSPKAKKAAYQINNDGGKDDSQFNMLKKLELSHEDHLELIEYCKEKDIKFFSTDFDTDGVHYLNNLGIDLFKIPSGEITNFPFLRAIAETRKSVILSTGMSTSNEIKEALNVLERFGLNRENIIILHCNTEYPTPMEDVNLKAMLTIGDTFGVKTGYSDHTLGIEVPTAAVAMGAVVIEKHFTIDKTLPGPDHAASLGPDELIAMVKAIRNIELALSGNGMKEPSKSELKNIAVVRKSIHLIKNLKAGEEINESNIVALRPGLGISPMEWENVIGKTLVNDKNAYDLIHWEDLK
jgi:N-acetylneuraminate synthase/N,N'-diacetyllegionaminate synthase